MNGKAPMQNSKIPGMKILYYCPEYYCNYGARAHARGFYNALQLLPNVTKTYLYPEDQPQDYSQGVQNKKRKRRKLWFLPLVIERTIRYFWPKRVLTRTLISRIKTCGCDAVVIRTGSNQPSFRQIKKACPDATICLEINAADFDEAFPGLPLKPMFQRWEARRYDQADAINVVSSHLKKYLEKYGVRSGKILVNQNGVSTGTVDLDALGNVRDTYNIPESAFVLGYVGGMEPFRRLPEVISYIAEMRRDGNEDVYLLIVGDGADMRSAQATIEAEGDVLKDSVKLTGWQDHAVIPTFLNTFDLAIFPFTNDYCSPLKLFEYLGAGLAAIGPDTSAVREVFEDGVHLKLVNQDGSDFISTVLELKNNSRMRSELGTKGRKLVLSEYTWNKNAERVVQHIQDIKTLLSR